jgi:predicted Zn-dependent protease
MKRLKWILFAAVGALLAVTAAQAQLGSASEKEIRRQARLLWIQMKRHLPVEPDQNIQRYVKCVTDRVVAQLPAEQRDAFEWEVLVFDDDDPQAMADPNGKISVFTGLFKVAENQDALAAVIGHEITHATEGHTLLAGKRAARQEAWATIGGAVTGSGYMANDLRNYLRLSLALPFAREQELEADTLGLERMARAGFDPREAMNLWKNMAAYSKSQGREEPRGLEATHPADDVRLRELVKVLAPALVEYNAAVEAGRRPNCQALLPPKR